MLSCAYKLARGATKGLLINLPGRDDGLETLEKLLDVCSSNSLRHDTSTAWKKGGQAEGGNLKFELPVRFSR